MKKFSTNLRGIMEERGLSIDDIRMMAGGVSRTTVHNWLGGSDIYEEHLTRLADNLGIDPVTLLYGYQNFEKNIMKAITRIILKHCNDMGLKVNPAWLVNLQHQAYSKWIKLGEIPKTEIADKVARLRVKQ